MMAGKMARSKGQRGEREVVKMLQPIVDRVCEEMGCERLTLGRNLIQTRSGGCDIDGLPHMAIEVKRVENLSGLPGWWRQAVRQGKESGREPVLMWRQNNGKWQVRVRVPVRVGPKGCTRFLRLVVNTDVETFLAYFEERLRQELGG